MRMWIDGKCFNIKNFEKHKKHITALTTKTSTEGIGTSISTFILLSNIKPMLISIGL